MPFEGYSVPIDEEDDAQTRLQKLLENVQAPPGAEVQYTAEGIPFYIPSGTLILPEISANPEVLPDQPEAPAGPTRRGIPTPKEETSYDVTPPELVPETPKEKLAKLAPTPEEELGGLAEGLPEEETPEEPRGFLEFATDPTRRFFASAIGETLASPWTLASLAATGQQAASEALKEGFAKVGGIAGLDPEKIKETLAPAHVPNVVGDLEKAWDKFGRGFVSQQRRIWGVPEEPKTGVEKLAQLTGESFVPAKQFTLPITFGVTGIRALLDQKQGITTVAQAAEDPLAKALGLGVPTGTTTFPTTVPMPGVTHTPQPRVPGMPKPSKQGLKQKKSESDEDFARRVDAKRIENEAKKAEAAKKLTPTVMDFFKDFGPRPAVPEFGILTGLVAGSLIAATAPWTFRAIRNMRGVRLPVPRSVTNAAPGTMTISDPKLYSRYFDDSTTAALNFLRKAGIEPDTVAHLELTARMSTRAGMRALIEDGVKLGEFRSVNFNFKAPKSLVDIARDSTPESDQYLKLLAAWEDLINEGAKGKYKPTTANPSPGAPTAAGMTEAQVKASIRALEQANPEVQQVAKDFAAWKRARRKFESDGQFSTMRGQNPNWNNPGKADRSFQWLNRQAKYSEGRTPTDTPFDQRPSPLVEEEKYSRRMFANRMENDYAGLFIDGSKDTMQGRTNIPLFKEVTLEELRKNPTWQPNAIRVFERGEPKYYTTDPTLRDQLLFDPTSITNPVAQAVYAAKRWTEMTNTGLPAYWFAPVDAARLWMQAKFTAPPGRWHPSLLHMALSVPGQVAPQAAKAFATWLQWGSGDTLAAFLGGRQNVEKLARSLVDFFDWTHYGQITKMGSARGSIISQEQLSNALAKGTSVAQTYGGPVKDIWNAYAALVSAIHESTGFAYTVQNWRKASPQQIVSEARKLGGDPRIQGEFNVIPVDPITGMKGTPRPPRFESPDLGQRLDAAWSKYVLGAGSEIGRTAIPWFNPTEQAIKSIGKAYLDNPVRFVRDSWLYVGLPYAANYYWNYSLGKDPAGRSYVDHLTEGRTPYASQMRMYWGWPGRNVEDGVEHDLIPQEFSFLARMFTLGMHHAFGKAKVFDELDDFKRAASGLLDVAVDPAAPSVMSAWEAMRGLVPGRGLFSGEAYRRKGDPFGEDGGMPQSLEAFARSLWGGVAQIAGAGSAAFTHSNNGLLDATSNAMKAAVRTANEKTMFVRDITGDLPPASMSTDISKAIFERQRVIDELAHYYNNPAQTGALNVVGGTTAGGRFLAASPEHYNLGPPQAPQIPGLAPKPPTNPLYNLYMQEMYNYFKHESPNPVKGEDQGGIGYKTIWARHGDASAALKTLKKVDEGNFATWQQQLETRPLAKEELQRAGVDTANVRQVKNYYIKKMQDVDRVILYAQLAVERKLSQQAGRPITIWDIRPYGKGVEGEPGSFIFSDLLGMDWGTDPTATGPVPIP